MTTIAPAIIPVQYSLPHHPYDSSKRRDSEHSANTGIGGTPVGARARVCVRIYTRAGAP